MGFEWIAPKSAAAHIFAKTATDDAVASPHDCANGLAMSTVVSVEVEQNARQLTVQPKNEARRLSGGSAWLSDIHSGHVTPSSSLPSWQVPALRNWPPQRKNIKIFSMRSVMPVVQGPEPINYFLRRTSGFCFLDLASDDRSVLR